MTPIKIKPLHRDLLSLAILALCYLLYLIYGKGGSLFILESQSEMGLYFRASEYIFLFWKALGGVMDGSVGLGKWLYNFVFHFSPGGFTEKPLFSFLLGYFRLFLKITGLDGPASDSYFNHLLATAAAIGAYIYFSRRTMAVLGLSIAAVLVSSPLATFVTSTGYHTTTGLFLFLAALALIRQDGRHAGLEALLFGLSFFASQHTAILPFTAVAVRLAYLLIKGGRAGLTGSIKYAACFVLPFALFFVRDLAQASYPLSLLSPPGLFDYAWKFSRASNFVYPAFLSASLDASQQNLPHHPGYLLRLLGFIYPGVHYLWYLALPSLFAVIKARALITSLREERPFALTALERSICFIALVLFSSLAIHSIGSVVTIARAFLPYITLLFILEFMLLYWVCERLPGRGGKAAGYAPVVVLSAAAALFFVLNTGYTSLVSRAYRDFGAYERALKESAAAVVRPGGPVTLEYGFGDFRNYLRMLEEAGETKLVLPPLITLKRHRRFSDEGKLCGLAVLKKYTPGIIESEVISPSYERALVLSMNEHLYHRFFTKTPTGPSVPGITDLLISKKLSYRHEYIFPIAGLLEALEREGGEEIMDDLSCETLFYWKD